MYSVETCLRATQKSANSLVSAPFHPSTAYLVLFALLLTIPSPARAQGQTAKHPRISVEEPSFTTEEIARDQVFDHIFRISNMGDAVLLIQKVMLPPNLELVSRPASLEPGKAGEIHVRVPLLLDKPGALLKQIELQTNDPDTPSVVLQLRIFSTEYVTASPGYARWISVQHEMPGTISQRLAARDGIDFTVLRTSPAPSGITSAISSTRNEPGSSREWKLDLTLSEDAPVGAIVGTLLVYVDHPKQKVVPIPLSGFMRPIMAVTPNTLSVGELALTAKQTQAFVVKSFSTSPIHITRVEHDLKGFPPADFETMAAGRMYRVKVDFDPATIPKGAFLGTLKIYTDSALLPVLTVPIDGTIL